MASITFLNKGYVKNLVKCLIILGCYAQLTHTFYLPGLAPVNYCKETETSPTCKVSIITKNRTLVYYCSQDYEKKSQLLWYSNFMIYYIERLSF